jgi:hypothetical protein
LGLAFPVGSHVLFAVEGTLDFLNEARYTAQESCVLPAGGTANCRFETRIRDLGRSLGGIVRFRLASEGFTPYALLGVGFLSTRSRTRSRATDEDGNVLPNFSGESHSNEGALQSPLGGGVVFGGPASHLRITIEARGTMLIYGYSGGPQLSMSPSVTIGFLLAP